ncbi:hypothetical protein [Actinosynnema sp. NPDC020468]|uniref:hypothetical protein n=1 Tax=Actinosynnema sp. NPDC020468 TaxID=3154488 RepID=UPI003401A9A4
MTHVRGPLLIAAAALLLSACGGTTSGTATTADAGTTARETTSAAESTTSSATKPSATKSGTPQTSSADATAPGTELKVGDRAVVPFKYGTDKSGTIAITVTAIEQGDNADLAKFGDKAKGITPFYVRVTVENLGGTDLAYSSVSLRGLGEDGKSSGVIISGETAKCESETAGKDFTTAGVKYETCVLTATREGAKIVAASFDKGDGYDKAPVVWKG